MTDPDRKTEIVKVRRVTKTVDYVPRVCDEMDEIQARACIRGIHSNIRSISTHFQELRELLLAFKHGRGWRYMLDHAGRPYRSMSRCLQTELEISRQRAYALIALAETERMIISQMPYDVEANLEELGEVGLVRLRRVPKSDRPKVFQRAVEIAQGEHERHGESPEVPWVRKRHVNAAVKEYCGPKPLTQLTGRDHRITDGVGDDPPEELWDVFVTAYWLTMAHQRIYAAIKYLEKVANLPGTEQLDGVALEKWLRQSRLTLLRTMPYRTCLNPTCKGPGKGGCKACNGHGWMSRTQFKQEERAKHAAEDIAAEEQTDAEG